jgi:hypothetical protein
MDAKSEAKELSNGYSTGANCFFSKKKLYGGVRMTIKREAILFTSLRTVLIRKTALGL